MNFAALSTLYPDSNDSEWPWFIYTGVVLAAIAPHKYISELWNYLYGRHQTSEINLQVARRLREALLKSSPLVGFARGINALSALKSAIQETDPDLQAELEKDKPLRSDMSAEELEKRGRDLFSKIYGQHTDKILQSMASTSGGDLNSFVSTSIYGRLMAETSIVNVKETVLLEFVICFATMAAPQAKGHMFGSRNVGNNKADIKAAMELVRNVYKQLGMKLDESEMKWTSKLDSWK